MSEVRNSVCLDCKCMRGCLKLAGGWVCVDCIVNRLAASESQNMNAQRYVSDANEKIDDLTARLAEAEAERDAMRDKMYAADAKAAHAKQQRDSIFRVAKVTKQNADGLRAIIRRCVNELEGWRCALAFRSGQTNAGEERVNKLIEDCLDAAPYTVTPADVFGTGEPKQ